MEIDTESAEIAISSNASKRKALASPSNPNSTSSASPTTTTINHPNPTKPNLSIDSSLTPPLDSNYSNSTVFTPKSTTTPKTPSSTPQSRLARACDNSIKKILGLTLTKSDPPPLEYLAIPEFQSSPNITVDMISNMLASRLALAPGASPGGQSISSPGARRPPCLTYLSAVYARTLALHRNVTTDPKELKRSGGSLLLEMLEEIKVQAVNYGCSAIICEDLFASYVGVDEVLVLTGRGGGMMTGDKADNKKKPSNNKCYLHALADELDANDGLEPFVHETITKIHDGLKSLSSTSQSPDSDQTPSLSLKTSLKNLCTHKKTTEIITEMPTFLVPPSSSPLAATLITPPLTSPNLPSAANSQMAAMMQMFNRTQPSYRARSGKAVEQNTLLGAVLSCTISLETPELASKFKGIQFQHIMNQRMKECRELLRAQQRENNEIFMKLLTGGPAPNSKTLQWFADALILNSNAAGMRPDPSKIASKTWLLNLSVSMMDSCIPFTVKDPTKSKLISSSFLSSSSGDGMGVYPTKGDDLVARCAEAEAEADADQDVDMAMPPPPPKTSNFISKAFFLTARSLHLGVVPLKNYASHLQQNFYYYRQQAGEDAWRTDEQVQNTLNRKMALDVALLDSDFLMGTLAFLNTSATFLTSLPSEELKTMPEHFIDDLCDIVKFVATSHELDLDAFKTLNFQAIFSLLVRLLSKEESSTINNYNLQAKLGDIIALVFLPEEAKANSNNNSLCEFCYNNPKTGTPLLLSDETAQLSLAPALLHLYGVVERTDLYECQKHRSYICDVVKYLFHSSEHRPAFMKIADDKQNFITFANGIINESTTLISSIMEKLPEIRNVQIQMDNGEWAAMSAEDRKRNEEIHEVNEREARSSLLLCNKTVAMFAYLTSDPAIKKLFLLDEMLDRLVSMLLHVLGKLVGSKSVSIKIDNAESYNFKPKELLLELSRIFINFDGEEKFAAAVSINGFFKNNIDLLSKAAQTVEKYSILTDSGDVMKMKAIAEKVDELAGADDMDELTEEAEKHHEEFVDPLTSELMTDPVELPTSNQIVDRKTIAQQLLNDPLDPFNRKKLTMDMVLPCVELKGRIDAFIAEYRERAKNKK